MDERNIPSLTAQLKYFYKHCIDRFLTI